jgi:hypothetical protein
VDGIKNSKLSNLVNQVATLSTNTVEVKTNLHKLMNISTKLFQPQGRAGRAKAGVVEEDRRVAEISSNPGRHN